MPQLPCCLLLRPHPDATSSRTVCENGHWWQFETEWAVVADTIVQLRHRMPWPGQAHDPTCEGCLMRPFVRSLSEIENDPVGV